MKASEPTNPRRIERLYRKHRCWLIQRARTIVLERDVAEDVVQAVFLRVLRSEDMSVRPSAAYLWTAVSHAAIDEHRRSQRFCNDRRLTHPRSADLPLLEMAGLLDDPDQQRPRPDGHACRELLALLAPGCRAVFELWLAGLTYAEIARRQGIAVNTVDVQLQRAKAKLRRHARRA
jgi:RNA polymerase sigma factor (sigma-70 family)